MRLALSRAFWPRDPRYCIAFFDRIARALRAARRGLEFVRRWADRPKARPYGGANGTFWESMREAHKRAYPLLALLLTACGGGGGPPPNTDSEGKFIGPPPSYAVYVQAVPPGTFPDDRLGEFRIVNGDGYVYVRSDILASATLARRTLAHELGHAVGVSHTAGNCVMDPALYQQPDLALCAPETAQAGLMPGTLAVYVGLAPGLLALTTDAAAAWNAGVGRTILDVQ